MEDPKTRVTAAPITTDGPVGCYGRGRCCMNNPGWFGPGEIEKTAELLGMSPEALFRKCLVVVTTHVVDVPGKPAIDLFAPAKVDEQGAPLMPTGGRVPQIYELMRGACIFYRNGRCDIHAARPVECRRYFCEQPDEDNLSRAELARLWWDAAQQKEEP